jgi:hypothetical protein
MYDKAVSGEKDDLCIVKHRAVDLWCLKVSYQHEHRLRCRERNYDIKVFSRARLGGGGEIERNLG